MTPHLATAPRAPQDGTDLGPLPSSARGAILPVVFSALTGGLWAALAFVPHHSKARLLLGVFAASAFFALLFAGVVASAHRWVTGDLSVVRLRRQLARCSLATGVLLLFLPEYLARVQPPLLRSSLLLAIVVLLWAALCLHVVRDERGKSLPERLIPRIAGAALVLLFATMTGLAIRKYLVFGYVGQDLAYFGQIMHTTLHGHLFWGNLLQDLIYSRPVATDFAGHNSPVMFLFLPFYALLPSPISLLVLRNLVLFACAWPVFLLARRSVSATAAWLWVAAFLLTPAILGQTTFDFYPLTLVALPLLLAIFFYLERRYLAFTLALAATLLVREDLVFFVFGIGLLALVQRRSARWSMPPLLVSMLWAVLSFKIILPAALHGATFVTDACFAHLGHGPADTARNIVLHPGHTLLLRNNIVYLKTLLTPPGLLLPFGGLVGLLSFPYIAINLLAGGGPCITTVISAQYSVIPATLLFTAALLTATSISRRNTLLSRAARLGLPGDVVAPLLLLALSCASLVFVTGQPEFDSIRTQAWHPEARHVLSLIPPGAAVAAPRYLLPHLANRDCLYQTHRLPQYHSAAYEYLIIDTDWNHIIASDSYRSQYQQVMDAAAHDPALETLYVSPQFRVYRDPRQHGKTCTTAVAPAAALP